MFRKLVSNLPFSPALVGQIGFYARRLRKEEMTRRIGLFMTALAIIVQSFVVFVPSTSANGSDENDMCPGVTRDATGARKVKNCYENNTRHYRDIMNYFGISKAELWKALDGSVSFRSTDTYGSWYTFGHDKRFSGDKNYSGEVPGTLYARKWGHAGNIDNGQYGWKGKSGETDFIILVNCGNLALKKLLHPSAACVNLVASKRDIIVGDTITLTAKASTDEGAEISKFDFTQDGPGSNDTTHSVKTNALTTTWNRTLSIAGTYKFTVNIDTTNSKDNITSRSCATDVVVSEKPIEHCPIPGKETLKKDDVNCAPDCTTNPSLPGCAPDIEVTKSAINRVQNNSDATKTKANGGDIIIYTITAKNNGKAMGTVALEDDLTDTLEYATLTDNGGASFNQSTRVLSWGNTSLKAGATTSRTFIITVKNPVPAMAQNHGTPASYDCIMSNIVRADGEGGINVPVSCPLPKEVVEQTIVKQLPSTGPGENMMFGGIVLVVVAYFWARSKQLGKEVRLVRKDFSAGTL
jgi:uncharacterized repeat protein (TIGR01451 family)